MSMCWWSLDIKFACILQWITYSLKKAKAVCESGDGNQTTETDGNKTITPGDSGNHSHVSTPGKVEKNGDAEGNESILEDDEETFTKGNFFCSSCLYFYWNNCMKINSNFLVGRKAVY